MSDLWLPVELFGNCIDVYFHLLIWANYYQQAEQQLRVVRYDCTSQAKAKKILSVAFGRCLEPPLLLIMYHNKICMCVVDISICTLLVKTRVEIASHCGTAYHISNSKFM